MSTLKKYNPYEILLFVLLCYVDFLLMFSSFLIFGYCIYLVRKEKLMDLIIFSKLKKNLFHYLLVLIGVFLIYVIYVYTFSIVFGQKYLIVLDPMDNHSIFVALVFLTSTFFSLVIYGYYFNRAINQAIPHKKIISLVAITFFMIHLKLGDYFMIIFSSFYIAYFYYKFRDLFFVVICNFLAYYLINFFDYKIVFFNETLLQQQIILVSLVIYLLLLLYFLRQKILNLPDIS